MAFVKEVVLAFTVISLTSVYKHGNCSTCPMLNTNRFNVNTGVKNRILRDRALKIVTIDEEYHGECYFECFKDCRCLSFNVCGKQCQLNVDTNKMRAAALKDKDTLTIQHGCTYYDLGSDTSSFSQCCSLSNPCLHGGTCTSHPGLINNRRFNCACAQGYHGELCQTHKPKTCSDYMAHTAKPLSGLHTLFYSNGSYSAYCDFDSEPNFAWTLVLSYSRGNASIVQDNNFNSAGLLHDVPVEEDNFNWMKFRFSLGRMDVIHGQSTHWRATCAFDEHGVDYDEYIRVNLSVVDFSSYYSSDQATPDDCQTVEYMNVRGSLCRNCSVGLCYWQHTPPFINPFISLSSKCAYNLLDKQTRCDNGQRSNIFLINWEKCYDPNSKCQMKDSSTIQNWFGTGPVET